MAFNIADRVKETTSTTGTGSLSLSGAVVGYQTFSSAVGNGNTCYYTIQNQTETEWEVGLGTVSAGMLSRDTVLASSNSGALVIFSSGTKYVYNTEPAIHLKSLVPYTGATASVNLGTYGLTSDFLQLSTTPTNTLQVGRMMWNDTDGTMDLRLKGNNVTLQVGQELVARVVNKTGASLTEAAYQVVRVSSAQGQRLAVQLAQGNSDANSAETLGIVTETIANNQEGFITTSGLINGINTTGSLQGETWADGDMLFLSPTTAGAITKTRPTAPNHTVILGYVVYAHANNGKIFVKIDNGYEIGELHDVYAPSPATGNGLFWNNSNLRYELNSIAGVLGYTPQAAITLTTTGSSGAATFVSNTLNIPTVTLAGLGGASDSLVMHLAGTETATGYKTFSIGLQTNTGDNYLNYTSGSTYIGYSAAPVGGYKLAVSGTSFMGNKLTLDNGIFQKNLYTDTSAGVVNFKIGTAYEIYGTLHSAGGYTTYLTTSNFGGSWDIIIGTNVYKSLNVTYNKVITNVDFTPLAGMSNITGNGQMSTYYSSPYEGFKVNTTNSWGYAIFNSANSPMMAVKYTGQLQLNNYTSTSVFTGTLAGLLGFDSSGNVITSAAGVTGSGTAGQVTYWSGTSAVTGSSNLFWDNSNGRLGIGTSSPSGSLHINSNPGGYPNGYFQITNTGVTFTDANFTIANGTTTAGQFLPAYYFTSNYSLSSATIGGIFAARITNANTDDIGLIFQANTKSGTALTQGWITGFRNLATYAMRISSAGNMVIQNGGTFTDAGYRLDVNGTGASTGALKVTGGLSLFQGGKMTIAAATTSYASLNIPSGTAPTTPANGDIWQDGSNIYIRMAGVTKTFTIV